VGGVGATARGGDETRDGGGGGGGGARRQEIEYKGQAIAELQQELARPAGGGTRKLDALLAGAPVEGLGAPEARGLLQECVRRVLDLEGAARARAAEAAALRRQEEELAEQVRATRGPAERSSERGRRVLASRVPAGGGARGAGWLRGFTPRVDRSAAAVSLRALAAL
jgi:hypothetical protein